MAVVLVIACNYQKHFLGKCVIKGAKELHKLILSELISYLLIFKIKTIAKYFSIHLIPRMGRYPQSLAKTTFYDLVNPQPE